MSNILHFFKEQTLASEAKAILYTIKGLVLNPLSDQSDLARHSNCFDAHLVGTHLGLRTISFVY